MIVRIDTHTHQIDSKNPFAIRNLNIEEVDEFLQTSKAGFCSVGIHPWRVHLYRTDIMDKIENWASDKRVVAIGECGLDRNSKANIKEQIFFFERQILLSEKLKKPMIIHCVACFNEIMNLRNRHNPSQNWVIHGFRGKPQLAQQLLNSGLALSFGEHFNPLSVEITPFDKLCIETDESNISIDQLYKNIASVKNCRPDQLNGACQLLKLYVC